MNAIYLTEHFKDASAIQFALTERPIPEIRKGECLVRMHSSGVNPSDALGAIGYFPHAVLPRIPGRDFSGVIVDGNTRYLGKKVWGSGGAAGLDYDGSHAEFLVIPENSIVEIPSNLSLLEAGVQTLPFITAYYSLQTRAKIKEGDRVLIIGALGQVGQAAMTICQWKRCTPVALVKNKEQLAQARELGWEASDHLEGLENFDVILNTIGNVHWNEVLTRLNKFGRMAILAAPEGKRDAAINLFLLYRGSQEILGINTVDLGFETNAKLLSELKIGFETNSLTPLAVDPETVFPLKRADEAYRMVLQNSRGRRIVLRNES
jgi:NADPH:quinone reductase-like Zn-dependent oxidoreductase